MSSLADDIAGRPRLPVDFYEQDPLIVAPAMLGSLLVHRHPDKGIVAGRIVETEVYRGEEDQACHARHGRTPRASALYGPPGRAYVYLIYGMYDLFNAVTWPEDKPAAVLVRALEPVLGIERTTNGPGRLTLALGIDRSHNGVDLTGDDLFIVPDRVIPASQVEASPRIGVDYAGEWAKRPWRYTVRGSRHLSR